MGKIVDIETLDAAALKDQSRHVVEAEKQCRIALSADAAHPVELSWHPGPGGRLSVINLEPGKAVVQPLSKAQVWFGPFAVPLEYGETTDERRRQALKEFWATEKMRVLNRYDYPRASHRDMQPIGPHRFPDVTVTILEADGTQHEPIRLHELYKIGEWDPLKDSFGPRETVDEVKARYEQDLEDRDKEIRAMRVQLAELAGMMKGYVAGQEA